MAGLAAMLALSGPAYASEGTVSSGLVDVDDYRLAPSAPEGAPVVTGAATADGAPSIAAMVAPPSDSCMLLPAQGCTFHAGFTDAQQDGAQQPALSPYGPADPEEEAARLARQERYRSFGAQVGAVKWEMLAILGYYTAVNGTKLFQDPTWPHFHKEGWFGEGTRNVGVDKLSHAYSSYVIADLLYARMKRKTGGAPGTAWTAAALAAGTMLYTEFWDSIEESAGWSWEDVTFNTLGSGFSVLRNTVPGLDRKLDYRLMIIPNGNLVNTEGKRHFEQQRYYFALKLAGFKAFEKSPFRLLELYAGYYGKDFTNEDRALGIAPKRRVFVGFGINLRELFFKNSKSRIGRAIGDGLDYFQPPYTAAMMHVTN